MAENSSSLKKAITSIYNAFIIFRLSDLVVEEFMVPDYVKISGDVIKADEVGNFFFEKSIHESERKFAEEVFDFSTMRDRLEKGGARTDVFKTSVHGWLETKLIPLENTPDGKIEKVLFCSRTINHEISLESNIETLHKLIHSGMWRVFFSADGKISQVDWSNEFRHMLGYESEEDFPNLLESWIMLLHPEDKEKAVGLLTRTIKDVDSSDVYDLEYRLRTKDRGYRWFRSAGEVSRRADGSPNCIFGVFLDVTDKMEKNELLELRNQALDEANKSIDAISSLNDILNSGSWDFDLNPFGEITFSDFGSRFKALLGFEGINTPNDWHFWFSRIHAEDQPLVKSAFESVVFGKDSSLNFDVECRIYTYRKGARWIHAAGKLTRNADGTPQHFYGLIFDIDESKLADEKIKNALTIAEKASNAKSEFLFNMSHDIRTPMNAIMGYTELMERNSDNPEKILEYIGKVKTANEFMVSLINNILEMTRIETGKIVQDLEVSNFSSLSKSILSVFESAIKEKNINFRQNVFNVVHDKVWYDPAKMRQVFLNILSNAVKFTPEGGSITVDVYETPDPKPGYALFQIEIADTGIGMSRDFVPHVFEEFSREHNSTECGSIGTGLGLPIVKRLVDAMGGKIFIESHLNVGTKVTVVLSFRIAASDEELGSTEVEDLDDCDSPEEGEYYMKCLNDVSKSTDDVGIVDFTVPGVNRILLAEDNDLNSEIAYEILSDNNYVVDVAHDGNECIEIVKSHAPDYYKMILMDIQMPGMNGYEATKNIREMKGKYSEIPIIAMTANAFDEDKQDAMEAGMNAHISKPFNVDKLLAMIEKFL